MGNNFVDYKIIFLSIFDCQCIYIWLMYLVAVQWFDGDYLLPTG